MIQYWCLDTEPRPRTIFRAPAEYIQQLSLSGSLYKAVTWSLWDGPEYCEHWTYIGLSCENGNFYSDYTLLTVVQAQIYYAHYSQLALIGNWTDYDGDGGQILDKWVVCPEQIYYDGIVIVQPLYDDECDLYHIIGEPSEDYRVFNVLSLSLAMSNLW
jgi:hypothetical protein